MGGDDHNARSLSTQWTAPNGLDTQRRPSISIKAIGVVRGSPDLRPRIVISAFGPIGNPAPSIRLASGLNKSTKDGTRALDSVIVSIGCSFRAFQSSD